MNGEDEGAPAALLESADEDGGYVSPEFDLPSDGEGEPSIPRRGMFGELTLGKKRKVHVDEDMDNEEQLALRLLGQPR